MPTDVYFKNHMLYSRPDQIPLFKLTKSGNRRCIDFKYSGRCKRNLAKPERGEQIPVDSFISRLSDEATWEPGGIFKTPRKELPMFLMVEINGEHFIEVQNHRTGKKDLIHVISVFELLLNEHIWTAA